MDRALPRLHGCPVRRDGRAEGEAARPQARPYGHRRIRDSRPGKGVGLGSLEVAPAPRGPHPGAAERAKRSSDEGSVANARPGVAELLPNGPESLNGEDPLPCVSAGQKAFVVRTPDRIRTGATALRGRRARPLHNGGKHCLKQPAELYLAVPQTCQSRPLIISWGRDLAGLLGLEPRLTGPEPVVLPITPYPTVLLVFGPGAEVVSHRLRAGEKPYTRGSEPSKTDRAESRSTEVAMPIRRAAQIASAR
jgi:hypothetical protein